MQPARAVHLVVQLQLADNGLYQRLAVGGVVDRKTRFEAYAVGIHSQETREYGVESAHPQLGSNLFANKRRNSLAHLAGGFVGESKRKYAVGVMPLRQQVHYLVGEHTGLARTRTGNHQLGSVHIFHCRPLGVVKVIQIVTVYH